MFLCSKISRQLILEMSLFKNGRTVACIIAFCMIFTLVWSPGKSVRPNWNTQNNVESWEAKIFHKNTRDLLANYSEDHEKKQVDEDDLTTTESQQEGEEKEPQHKKTLSTPIVTTEISDFKEVNFLTVNPDDIGRYFAVDLPQPYLKTLQNLYMETHVFDAKYQKEITYKMNKITVCPKGYFRINGMKKCRKIAACDELGTRLKLLKQIDHGAGKMIFTATLDELNVIVALVNFTSAANKPAAIRAKVGMENIIKMQGNPYVTPVLGHCLNFGEDSALVVLEGCFKYLSLRKSFRSQYNMKLRSRMEIATQLIASVYFLQESGKHPRVLCDLHNPTQSLGQFLLSDTGKVYLNDLDEIPEVDEENGQYAYCRTETHDVMDQPEFIPPEQRYTPEEYRNNTHIKPVTEKSDVWKIPLMTNILLFPINQSLNKEEQKLHDDLKRIHDKCHTPDLRKRPGIRQLLMEYLRIFKQYYE